MQTSNSNQNSLIRDKHNVLQSLPDRRTVVLELGCGPVRRHSDSITIDISDNPNVDIVADLDKGLPFLSDSSIDEIRSYHFLEHIQDLGQIMKEFYRILKPGGKIIGTVPHFSNPYYYSDYTHRSPFGLYTFSYFSRTVFLKRQVPNFYSHTNFGIKKIDLIFLSPFAGRQAVKRVFQAIFNSTNYLKEFYEENLCYMMPAYEIYFELEKS